MSLSKAVTIDWCHGSHKSVNTLISREPETTMPFTAWAIQMDKPLLHKWGTDQKLTLNEVWKTWKNRYLLVPLHRFHGSVNPTKSGPGLRKLQKYLRLTQLMCANTFCSSLIYKLSPSFRSPTCKGMNKWQTKWERPILVLKAGQDIQGQNLSMLLTLMYVVFIHFFPCLHLLQHFTVWETLHGTDFLPASEHPQLL